MPRQSRSGGGGRAPSRPTAPQRQVAPQQTRPATTAAYPPATRPAAPPAPAQQSSGGGSMLGNIASTAMGVAAGHGLSNMLFGGRGEAPAAEQAPQQNGVAAQGNETQQNNSWGQSCEVDAKSFTKCLDENQGNIQICGWYLEQLKACQQAAKQY
ncbi:related to small unique nuclear receptor co-repressor [Rhynchosporium secalis]|uniref:Related to small unique nuclear receptor co-repressor n=1 Tax=Rhynchosporium secalis TaxID=38038 RepID=A0A1E1MPG6_RHYSE|nr:related to small unique nuclear receptor co-repressor [Rhynchosporium secalis]